jgi:hypothetical protein
MLDCQHIRIQPPPTQAQRCQSHSNTHSSSKMDPAAAVYHPRQRNKTVVLPHSAHLLTTHCTLCTHTRFNLNPPTEQSPNKFHMIVVGSRGRERDSEREEG